MKTGFIILLTLVLSGCTTVRLNPDSETVETKLSTMKPLPVRCAVSVWNYGDDFRPSGLPFRNETGKSFIKIFSGTSAANPVIEITASRLTATLENMGFVMVLVYDVTIQLREESKTLNFTAHSTYRATGFTTPGVSAKIVTEDAIAQLAVQVMTALGQQKV